MVLGKRRPTTIFLPYGGVVLFLFQVTLLFHSSVIIVVCGETVTTTTTTTVDSGDENDDKVNFVKLEDMTDKQLEAICTNRGFELLVDELKDETSGNPLTWEHDDYVEAAQQCLDVESEMEKMLKERPNILKELEKERDEMLKTKEMLEVELAAKLRQQQQLEEEERLSFVGDEDDGQSSWSTTDSSSSTTKTNNNNNNNNNNNYRSIKKDKIQPMPNSSYAAAENNNNNNNDKLEFVRVFKETVQEVKAEAQRKFELVSDLLVPKSIRGPLKDHVIRPMIRIAKYVGTSALDMLKRYVLLLIESASNQLDKNKKQKVS